MARRRALHAVAAAIAATLLLPVPEARAGGGRSTPEHEPRGVETFASPQSDPIAVSDDGQFVYVANTTSGTLGIIDVAAQEEVRQVRVGLDPVSVAIKPDGSEVWVANHVSDSVSVVDVDPASASYRTVVETVQLLDAEGATLFDEPVGIAFASDSKAYVALSSRNEVAVVDASTYSVTGKLDITAQDPRALAVRDGLLYVAAFESGNQTELSACEQEIEGSDQCTLDTQDLLNFAQEPNLPGVEKNIVVDPDVPDRDLFVFDTSNDQLVATASGVGTLLYGLAPGPSGTIYVSQTDARNAVNGLHGQTLAELENHFFDNEIAEVSCGGGSCSTTVHPAEPVPPQHSTAFATPYGIALSGDDSVLLATAAASSRLATFPAANPSTGPLDVLDVGPIPRGVAFDSTGATGTAFVLNTLGNGVSMVDVDSSGALTLLKRIPVGDDPTPSRVRKGRIAFNNAFASTSGNFACASCHPDGNTDQLLWRIGGSCLEIGCDPGDHPRTTMPIRGVKNTLPLHWDGTLGDPFGGGNGAVGAGGDGGTGCSLDDSDGDHDCFRDLVEATLAGPMCDQSTSCPGDELSDQEIDDMATFLDKVSYPPARSRRMDDTLSRSGSGVMVGDIEASALQGFADFFTDQGGNDDPKSCADSDAGCHSLPLGTDTNSASLNGFDVPTMRGMTDRFIQFSLAPTGAEEVLVAANDGFPVFGVQPLEEPIQWDPAVGLREITTFGAAFTIFEPVYNVRPIDLFQMFEEASTGFSGATGRQVTLNTATAGLQETVDLMSALEDADLRGVVNLRAEGLRKGSRISLSFRSAGVYRNDSIELTPAELRDEASTGTTLATLTGELRKKVDNQPAPLLDTAGSPGGSVIGDPPLAQLTGSASSFGATGTRVRSAGDVFLDGQRLDAASISCGGSATCDGTLTIDLGLHPSTDGLHLVQVQNPNGLLSNELPICVGSDASNCLSD